MLVLLRVVLDLSDPSPSGIGTGSGCQDNTAIGRLFGTLPAIDLSHGDLARGKQHPEHMASLRAGATMVRVLILRVNSSCERSIA